MPCCRVGAPDPAMDAVLLHCLNHCNKAADAIKKGNEALKGAPKGSADAPRDQGFARPKVAAQEHTQDGGSNIRP